jgi:hypothetical protein
MSELRQQHGLQLSILHQYDGEFLIRQKKGDPGAALSFSYKTGNQDPADTGKCICHRIGGITVFPHHPAFVVFGVLFLVVCVNAGGVADSSFEHI